MFSSLKRWFLLLLMFPAALNAQEQMTKPGAVNDVSSGSNTEQTSAPDLTKQPTLYVVPYAHLDTQWRWDYPTTIKQYLPSTMRDNFALFEKYLHYIFDFSGAMPYDHSYLYARAIDLPENNKTLTPPNNDKIRVLAITVADESEKVRAAQPLYDTLQQQTAGERGPVTR